MRRLWIPAVFAISATAFGCLDQDKADEEDTELLDDSKADSHLKPTHHGVILFGIPEHAVIGGNERFHAWTFELTGNAQVDMTTSYSVLGQRRTDTVLYLYKQKPDGKWGSYIARNDDYGSTTYSQLKKSLGAGNYRVLVKGHLASTTGKFKIAVNCAGAGCTPPEPPPSSCVFGDTYREIFEDNPYLQVINTTKIYPNTLATLNLEDRHRLMLAVQQSSHDDVTTPEEAILRVDQEEVNVTWIVEPAAQRMFIAFEYGAGDNSYGAVFERFSGEMVTNIHDGDLETCATPPADCLFPDDWNGLRFTTSFMRTATRTVTDASQLTGVAAEQAIATFKTVYEDDLTIAQGLEMADGNEINVHTYRHVATGTNIDVFEFGAGDTSVGQLFYAGTTIHAARINDLSIDACTFFAP